MFYKIRNSRCMTNSHVLTTMAASPADVRELRRQKLLQLSEQRLQKILKSVGHSDDSPEDPSTQLLTNDGNTTNPQEVDSGPKTAAPATSSIRSLPSQTESPNISSNTADNRTTEAGGDVDKSYTRRRVKTNDAFAESRFPGISTSKPSSSPNSSPRRSPISSGSRAASESASNKITLSLLHFDLIRLVSCIVLALLTRKILNTAWSTFFLKSIFVPFTLLQFGIYTFLFKFCKAVVLPERGSMISTGLIVCGVDKNTVLTFHKVIGYTASVVEDLAVYIFSFVLADSLIG